MILTKNLIIKVNPTQISYLSLFYENIKSGDILDIDIKHLPSKSSIKIEVCCDICNIIKNISISNYNKNINNGGYYSCSQKCSKQKTILTNINKYGKHPSKLKENREKAIKTSENRYGENYMKCDIIKNKITNNNIEKYGVEYPLMSPYIREKCENTNYEKYGHKNPFQVEQFKDKIKKTNIHKYGFENPQQCQHIHEKSVKSGYLYNIHKNGLSYQGTYEKHFIDLCDAKGIFITKAFPITYIFKGKKKRYYPDFYLKEKNLIIEVKSSFTYYKDYEINIQKQKYTINLGYNFLFIIDKDYNKFINIYENNTI